MTKPLRSQLAVVFGLLVFTLQAGAQSIYSQSPPDPTSARTSDFAYRFVNQQAQSFTLAADTNVQAITAWGNYNSGLPNDDFTIRFYADAAGSPATTPFAQLTPVTAIREYSGLNFTPGGNNIYKYTINLNTPVALIAGTTYYFSIVNNTTDAEHWNWTGFSGGNDLRWNRLGDTNAWGSAGPPNLAFELYDAPIPTDSQAVPVMPVWLIGFMAIAVAAIASVRIRR